MFKIEIIMLRVNITNGKRKYPKIYKKKSIAKKLINASIISLQ